MTIYYTIGLPAPVGGTAVAKSQPRVSAGPLAASTASSDTANIGEIWFVTPTLDGFIEFGAAPDGAGTTRWRVTAGFEYARTATVQNEKVAFVT